jgi:serine/threonine-protein kinase
VSAGQTLKLIHTLKAPAGTESWARRYKRKIERNTAMAEQCREQGIEIVGADYFLQCVAANKESLADRPNRYQHGDFHPGNMVVTPNGSLSIIDWSRQEYGDPWEEFSRLTFTAAASPDFANGQLHGYFEGEPPFHFFELPALYIANTQLGTVGWALPFGDDEIAFTQAQNASVLTWFDNYNTVVPAWYRPPEII